MSKTIWKFSAEAFLRRLGKRKSEDIKLLAVRFDRCDGDVIVVLVDDPRAPSTPDDQPTPITEVYHA